VFIRLLEHVYDVGQWWWCVLAGDEGRFVQLHWAEEHPNDKVSLVESRVHVAWVNWMRQVFICSLERVFVMLDSGGGGF
jgi:hypothetical protein